MEYKPILLVFFVVLESFFLVEVTASEAFHLTNENYEDTLKKHKVIVVNFYADWCGFSQQLKPIFDQAAGIVSEEYPDQALLAKVDCEAQSDVSQKNGISKYPTIKVFRNGEPMRKEYRGARSVDAFTNYIRSQMKTSVREFHAPEDFDPEFKKNNVIGYFEGKAGENYKAFEKVADSLREDCDFLVGFGDASIKERATGDNIVFRPQHTSGENDAPYTSSLTSEETLKAWAQDKCIPLVREINFENGEELTEEGLPFLLLFHNSDDIESVKKYKEVIATELIHEKGTINFLTADGTKFSHPLHHIDKSEKDLPLIAIDSFRHMYVFPKFEDINIPGKLKQFLDDLHSGKLHREYHNGPDPSQIAETPETPAPDHVQGHGGMPGGKVPDEASTDQATNEPSQQTHGNQQSTSGSGEGPPETIFSKLLPSENRYTLLNWRGDRDEL